MMSNNITTDHIDKILVFSGGIVLFCIFIFIRYEKSETCKTIGDILVCFLRSRSLLTREKIERGRNDLLLIASVFAIVFVFFLLIKAAVGSDRF